MYKRQLLPNKDMLKLLVATQDSLVQRSWLHTAPSASIMTHATHVYGIHNMPKVLVKPKSSALLTSAKLKLQSMHVEQEDNTYIHRHT